MKGNGGMTSVVKTFWEAVKRANEFSVYIEELNAALRTLSPKAMKIIKRNSKDIKFKIPMGLS